MVQAVSDELTTSTAAASDSANKGMHMCLVLDEKAIDYCGTLCKDVLAAVSNSSHSVVACRARKDQKVPTQTARPHVAFIPASHAYTHAYTTACATACATASHPHS